MKTYSKDEVLRVAALIEGEALGGDQWVFASTKAADMLRTFAHTLGEPVAYYCTKLRDRYGDDDKITGEKWLEEKVTMDHNEAAMLERDFAWTVHDLYTRINAKAGEVDIPEIPDGWQPIESAPSDGTPHVRGLHVFSSTDGRFLYWDAIVGHIDDEDGLFYDPGGDVAAWDASDFTHWHPLAEAPALSTQRGDGSEMGDGNDDA